MTSRDEKILKTLGDALAALSDMRVAEGRQLTGIVETLLTEIETLLARAKDSAAAQPQAIYAKTKELLDELISQAPPLSEDRLHQEVALIAGRADVREELDRLSAHLISARALIGESGSVGRKLDFLCQEFNREPGVAYPPGGAWSRLWGLRGLRRCWPR